MAYASLFCNDYCGRVYADGKLVSVVMALGIDISTKNGMVRQELILPSCFRSSMTYLLAAFGFLSALRPTKPDYMATIDLISGDPSIEATAKGSAESMIPSKDGERLYWLINGWDRGATKIMKIMSGSFTEMAIGNKGTVSGSKHTVDG